MEHCVRKDGESGGGNLGFKMATQARKSGGEAGQGVGKWSCFGQKMSRATGRSRGNRNRNAREAR
jgi:hypothetical protein